MVSSPPSPMITSLPGVPLRTSWPAVPTIVAGRPRHVGTWAPAGWDHTTSGLITRAAPASSLPACRLHQAADSEIPDIDPSLTLERFTYLPKALDALTIVGRSRQSLQRRNRTISVNT